MVKKWSIYWVTLDPVQGSEQAGIRPALVISNDMVNEILPVVTIISISSVKNSTKAYPTEVLLNKAISGLDKDSVLMVHQIRTVSKIRINRKCGQIDDTKIRNDIFECMKNYFDLY